MQTRYHRNSHWRRAVWTLTESTLREQNAPATGEKLCHVHEFTCWCCSHSFKQTGPFPVRTEMSAARPDGEVSDEEFLYTTTLFEMVSSWELERTIWLLDLQEQQRGFGPGCAAVDPMGHGNLTLAVDLEKVYQHVPRGFTWWGLEMFCLWAGALFAVSTHIGTGLYFVDLNVTTRIQASSFIMVWTNVWGSEVEWSKEQQVSEKIVVFINDWKQERVN